MYFISASFADQLAYFVTINSTDKYMAVASADGNITTRSISKFTDLIPESSNKVTLLDSNKVETQLTKKSSITPSTTEKNTEDSNGTTSEKSTGEATNGDKIVLDKSKIPTEPISQMESPPTIDKGKFQQAQSPDNITLMKTRSKIIALRYANTHANAHLLVAVYKNGDVYLLEHPENRAKCKVTHLFKHTKDALVDVSWSADDQLLAFSSLNDEIIIYDVFYRHKITTINFQTKEDPAIKGIAFDKNVGKYLLALKDDRSLSIIDYALVKSEEKGRDFQYTISQTTNNITLKNKLNKTTIRRVSWSMDGEVFSIPNSAKGKLALLSLFHKGSSTTDNKWDQWCSLIGHGFKCTMSQFSPIVYENPLYVEGVNQRGPYENKYSYILATASSDSTVAIWNTACEAPLLIANEVCSGPIQDMVWSNDGSLLFITSATGDLMMGVFDNTELGTPVKEIDNREMNAKAAELSSSLEKQISAWRKGSTVEIVDEDEVEEVESKNNIKTEPTLVKSVGKTKSSNAVSVKPVDTKGSNENTGKLKVTSVSSSVKEESTKVNPPDVKPLKVSTTLDNKSVKSVKPSQVSTIKNGKKRIQPMLISSSSNSNGVSSITNTTITENGTTKRGVSSMEFDLPSYSVSKELSTKVTRMAKAMQSEDGENNNLNGHANKKAKREVEPYEFIGSVVLNPSTSFSNVRISTAKVRSWIRHNSTYDDSLYLEIKNGNGTESAATRVALLKKTSTSETSDEIPVTKQLFVDFIPNRVHLVTGGEGKFWAISTVAGQIIVYSDSGRTLIPPIILGSPLSFLECKNEYLMAVTSLGEVYVWDIPKKKILFPQASLYPLLQPIYRVSSTDQNGNSSYNVGGVVFFHGDILSRSENLTMCSVTSSGIPIVTLSNGNGYLYNSDLNSWTLISDTWWAFGSQYWDSTSSLSHEQGGDTVLSVLERHTNEEIMRKGKGRLFAKISKAMMMREGYENLETAISLNHLENKLLIYEVLKDSKNFKSVFLTYANRLGQIPMKARLDEICKELFFEGATGKICGILKHELLREVILTCSKYREVQRILSQYASIVNLIDEDLLS